MTLAIKPGRVPGAGGAEGGLDLRKEFRVRAPRLISVRGVEALGHMMLDRVYPDVEPQVVGVGAAAQSETGGPEGAQVK